MLLNFIDCCELCNFNNELNKSHWRVGGSCCDDLLSADWVPTISKARVRLRTIKRVAGWDVFDIVQFGRLCRKNGNAL